MGPNYYAHYFLRIIVLVTLPPTNMACEGGYLEHRFPLGGPVRQCILVFLRYVGTVCGGCPKVVWPARPWTQSAQ